MRIVLIVFGALIAYSMVLQPQISWIMRDPRFDANNIFKIGEVVTLSLHEGTKSKADKYLRYRQPFWSADFNYTKKRYVINQTFTLNVPSHFEDNKTIFYVILSAKQKSCTHKDCPVLSRDWMAINWFTPKVDLRHSLLSEDVKEIPSPTPIPYFYNTARFDLIVQDVFNWQLTDADPSLNGIIQYIRAKHIFYPPLTVDKFFDIPTERRRLNITEGSNFTVNFEINFRGKTLWAIKNLYQMVLDKNDFMASQFNEMKRAFIETEPILLYSTIIATILHSIFQLFAFERDLNYWSHKKTFRGTSLRTIALQLLGELIVFLDLFENDRIPKYLKVFQFASVATGFWKIMKMVKLSKKFPFIKVRKECRGETDEADAAGMKILYIAVLPMIVVYSIYQLKNGRYRGIRHYFIHCATGAVYSFGFLAMLPQLYVNYKLKTVAGMSKSAFAYKFLNTFIDDLYTFVSKLPLMHKIACFRDDVVFVIWLVQCLIYPTDPNRVNEFGLVAKNGEEEEDKEEKEPKESDEEEDKLKEQETEKQKTD